MILVLALVIGGCGKGKSLAQLQKDGYGCNLKGGGAGFVGKPGEHCFECPDSAALQKCTQNPLESTCKEVECGK